ncbi:unnamed protein product, partial [Phaeothamnion confervicola]
MASHHPEGGNVASWKAWQEERSDCGFFLAPRRRRRHRQMKRSLGWGLLFFSSLPTEAWVGGPLHGRRTVPLRGRGSRSCRAVWTLSISTAVGQNCTALAAGSGNALSLQRSPSMAADRAAAATSTPNAARGADNAGGTGPAKRSSGAAAAGDPLRAACLSAMQSLLEAGGYAGVLDMYEKTTALGLTPCVPMLAAAAVANCRLGRWETAAALLRVA